jgi:hypothetical protein
MAAGNIDEFASSLLEEAKRFLEKATGGADASGAAAYLHAALMLGFCALEAHVNGIADDFARVRSDLSLADKGILLEKELRLEHGEFRLSGLRMYRLEDRILFLHQKFGRAPLDRTAPAWGELLSAMDLRNQLTHPRRVPTITAGQVERALRAIIDVIDALFRGIYNRPLPAAGHGLQSKLVF